MKTRALNEHFFNNFKSGDLNELLNIIKNDPSLIMCFRGDRTSVYYRAKLILEINQSSQKYSISFTKISKDYCPKDNKIDKPSIEWNKEKWIEYFQKAKYIIDRHCVESNQPCLEKEIQQIMFRENSCNSIAEETDYFIFDIEYSFKTFNKEKNKKVDTRFDALAMYWPRDDRSKTQGKKFKLAIIELKAGKDAIDNTSGLKKHYEDVKYFINDKEQFNEEFLDDMSTVFAQMMDLGLIHAGDSKPELLSLNEETKKPKNFLLKKNKQVDNFDLNLNKIQFILALANYNDHSVILQQEIGKIEFTQSDPFDTLFATSSFMGYGLYEECMISLSDMKQKYEGNI